jgi:cysteine-rich repeat protein
MASRARPLSRFVLLLALLSGCDCAGDTGPVDAGDGGADATVDAGPRRDAGTAECGNTEVEEGEECDDGNTDPDDGCSADCQLECGDGEVTGDELCDTAIAPGGEGACPTSCDDGDSCTTDNLDGAACGVSCGNAPITLPADDDLCCPTGADASTDNDCAGSCGDGFRTGAELCDTAIPEGSVGACPTGCDDGMACTTDELVGGGSCDAVCLATPITAAVGGDGCCPTGATIGTDADCPAACGDGVLSAGEACDTGIASGPGACPTGCDDGAACTADALMGAGTCDAVCGSTPITTPVSGDGCCPSGGTIATDSDCTGVCGDGVLSPGESCDTAITSGGGRCPTSCSDGIACTLDVLSGAGTCAATCSAMPITAPANGDGCCPTGASIGTDNDCPARCGDGVVSSGETCDTAIASGAGACPTTCSDGMVCTRDTLANMGSCTAACMFSPITTPAAGDGCCPTGATIATDTDCAARCGDRVITAPETCDDGNTMSGDGCSATCTAEAVTTTAFRLTDLDLRDPHVFASVIGCNDLTNSVFGIDGVNPLLQDNLRTDGDMDGLLDLSIVQVFQPLVQMAGSSTMSRLTFPECTAPLSSTTCTLPATGDRTMTVSAMNQGGGAVCLGTLPGTFRSSYGAIVLPTAPAGGTCYAASAGTVTIDLGGIPIRLQDAQIGGEYFGSPATEIRDGLIRGFISYADAMATIIPAGTTGIGAVDGQPLARLLRTTSTTGAMAGACGSSATNSDLDMGPGGVPGWYFYLNFSGFPTASPATRVTYSEL